MRKIVEKFMRPFRRRRKPASSAPSAPYWRLPESGAVKKSLIDGRWGKNTVPTVMVFDLTPLRSLSHDDEIDVARQFFGEGKFPSGAITYRESQSSEHPMTYLTVKYAHAFHAEARVRGHRLPLYRVSHRPPGRSGTVIEFKDLVSPPLDVLQPTG